MRNLAEQNHLCGHVKEDPAGERSNKDTHIKIESSLSYDAMNAQEERCTSEDMAIGSLYVEHEERSDLVVDPKFLQPLDELYPIPVPSIKERVTVNQEPSHIESRKGLEEQFGLRKCSVRLERIPQHIKKRCLKYLSKKNNSNKKISKKISFTYYNCQKCKRQFAQQKNLRRPYSCQMCEKQSVTKPVTHPTIAIFNCSRERLQPYSCKFCTKKFEKSSDLASHKERHLKREEPFKCKLCPGSFIEKKQWTKHKLVHVQVSTPDSEDSDDPSYSCGICCQHFRDERYLAKHLICHLQQPFFCKLCMCSFTSKKELVAHNKEFFTRHSKTGKTQDPSFRKVIP